MSKVVLSYIPAGMSLRSVIQNSVPNTNTTSQKSKKKTRRVDLESSDIDWGDSYSPVNRNEPPKTPTRVCSESFERMISEADSSAKHKGKNGQETPSKPHVNESFNELISKADQGDSCDIPSTRGPNRNLELQKTDPCIDNENLESEVGDTCYSSSTLTDDSTSDRNINGETPKNKQKATESFEADWGDVNDNEVTPPVVIHPRRSVKLDDISLHINDNVAFSPVNIEPHRDTKIQTTSPTSFKSKLYDKIKKCEQLKKHSMEFPVSKESLVEITEDKECCESPVEVAKNKECCDKCDHFLQCTVWCDNNIQFTQSNSIVRKGLPLLKQFTQTEINKINNNHILVHGKIIPKPVNSLERTYFNESVQKRLQTINCSTPTTIQTYIWPSVQRSLNVFMVAPPNSGKTLAYLPAMCSFSLEKSGRYSELSQYEGPLIVILCPDTKKCEALLPLIDNFVDNDWDNVSAKMLTDGSCEAAQCEILVATPALLDAHLKSGTVKLKRLCHLVLEDTDTLMMDHHETVGNLFQVVNRIQSNRPHNKNVQVVVTSQKWTVDMQHLLVKLYTTPVVVFTDFFQAAIYSKVNFVKKKLSFAHRRFYLEDILRKEYSIRKTIIFCKDTEIPELCEYLELKGIECICISSDIIEDEIFENEDMWCSLKTGYYRVLLCTDALFEKTSTILNANWLIHYSLPSNWTQFQQRFRSLSANFKCPLEGDYGINPRDCCCFIIETTDALSNQICTQYCNILTRSLIAHFQLTL